MDPQKQRSSKIIRIVVAHANVELSNALSAPLRQPDCHVVVKVNQTATLFDCIKKYQPNVMILPLAIAQNETAMNHCRHLLPTLKIIVCDHFVNDFFQTQLDPLHVNAYVCLQDLTPCLLQAVRVTRFGQPYFSTTLVQQIETFALTSKTLLAVSALSHKELTIFLLIIQGKTNLEIANGLHLSAKTIACYRYRLFLKLGLLTSVAEAQ